MKTNPHLILTFVIAANILLAGCAGNAPTALQATAAPGELTAVPPTDSTAATAVPATSATGLVDTGFRPEANGFAIPNYGGEVVEPQSGQTSPVVNLTPVEMRRLFGDAVCAAQPDNNGACLLTPPASQWMEQNNASMNGGHCEGFAVLSQLIYGGIVDPKQFGADRAIDLKIPGNERLQREIAYWFATQGPTWDIQQVLPPKEMVDFLKTEYAKDGKNIFRLGIMKSTRGRMPSAKQARTGSPCG